MLCEQFKSGAEEKGHNVKLIRIMEANIGYCRACDGCMRNGGTCVLKDDMAEILELFKKQMFWFWLHRCTFMASALK